MRMIYEYKSNNGNNSIWNHTSTNCCTAAIIEGPTYCEPESLDSDATREKMNLILSYNTEDQWTIWYYKKYWE